MKVSKKNYCVMESFHPSDVSGLFFEENSMFSVMDVEVLDECNYMVSLMDKCGNGIAGVEITLSTLCEDVIFSDLTDDDGVVLFVIDEKIADCFKVKSYSAVHGHTSFIFF